MFLRPIRSTALSRVGYEPYSRRLYIEFRKDRSLYVVFGVRPALYQALLDAQPHPWTKYQAQIMRLPKQRIYGYAA